MIYPIPNRVFSWYNDFVREKGDDRFKQEEYDNSDVYESDDDSEILSHPHDLGYKYLFAHKENFLELLQNFIQEPWIRHVDPDRIERLDKSFVLPDFHDHEADVLYRLRSDDQDVFFYFLLELQSQVDYRMPYRLLLYMTDIWRDEVKKADAQARNKRFRLPVIVPIVLYNGERNWTASRNFKNILNDHEHFSSGLLDFRYHVIEVNRYTEEELLSMGSLMAGVLLMDKRRDVEVQLSHLQRLAEKMGDWEEQRFYMFMTWVCGIIGRRLPEEKRQEMKSVLQQAKPKEAKAMMHNLERAVKEAMDNAVLQGKREGKLEGMREGKLEGKLEGKIEGKLEVALRMLAQGMERAEVMKLTGLTEEEWNKIKH